MISAKTLALRDRVYRLMGGCCVVCGESDFAKLTIDHVHNDGHRERREVRLSGGPLYAKLLMDGIPSMGPYAKVLKCFNCNLGKTRRHETGQGEEATLPAAPNKVQIRLTVSTDTAAFLEQRESPKHPKGEVVDEIVVFYQTFASVVSDQYSQLTKMLEDLVLRQAVTVDVTEPATPPPAPYAHRLRDEPVDASPAPVTEPQPKSWWRR